MPRIPYKTDQEAEQAGPAELIASIRKRRGGRLGALDRILLHSPPFASGWGELLGRVRGELAVPMVLRELAMCAVAVLNEAEYELHHHGPIFLSSGGSPAQLDALRRLPAVDAALFDTTQQAALQLAVEMTRQVKVSDATFEAARRALGSERHLFELIGVIAAYNMVSRILVAVGVEATD
ncbi:MAG TPA: carboxymuconolactone decarboxylase family protein [Burkholderiaceae bacterium]